MTAPQPSSQPPRILTEAQWESFLHDGYLTLNGLVGEDW